MTVRCILHTLHVFGFDLASGKEKPAEAYRPGQGLELARDGTAENAHAGAGTDHLAGMCMWFETGCSHGRTQSAGASADVQTGAKAEDASTIARKGPATDSSLHAAQGIAGATGGGSLAQPEAESKADEHYLVVGDKCWAKWIEEADDGKVHFYKARVIAVHSSDDAPDAGGGGGGGGGGVAGYTIMWDDPDGYDPTIRLPPEHVSVHIRTFTHTHTHTCVCVCVIVCVCVCVCDCVCVCVCVIVCV